MLPLRQETPNVVNQADFEYFKSKISDLCGITLSDAKKELLQSRLRSRISKLELGGFSAYRKYLEQLPRDHGEWQELINSMTTNKTDWFREPAHFEFLVNQYLPNWKTKNNRKLNVWCAASSTGEEPYTLATVLNKNLPAGSGYEILGTDIDTKVLKEAQNGVYTKTKLEQVPEQYRDSTFAFGTGGISSWMKVRSQIKKDVSFKQFNLTEANFPWENHFDIIFCRNVFIYFNKPTIETIIEKFYKASRTGAILCIGHSESLQNNKGLWTYVKPSIFIKK